MSNKRNIGFNFPFIAAFFSALSIIIYFFFPFYSIPQLRYFDENSKFTIFNIKQSIEKINDLVLKNSQPISIDKILNRLILISRICTLTVVCLFILLMLFLYFKKYRAQKFCKLVFFVSGINAGLNILVGTYINILINNSLEVKNSFFNLTIFSKVQSTSYPYFLMLLSIGFLLMGSNILLKNKRTKISLITIIVIIPFIIAFGIIFLNNRSYYFISLCVVVAAMIPFFMAFEDKKPKAREIVIISIMVVIATGGRAAFFMIPHFKPVTAIVIIAGINLGAGAGFLTGAMTGFASNFFFGQGPWTPWQMFAFGIIGFLSGIVFKDKDIRNNKLVVCIFGFFATFIVYGLIVDTSSVLAFLNGITFKSVLAVYISGIPINFMHALSTIVFLYLLLNPMNRKIERIKEKYGIISD